MFVAKLLTRYSQLITNKRLHNWFSLALINHHRSICLSSCNRSDFEPTYQNMANVAQVSKKDWTYLRQLVSKSYQQIGRFPIDAPFSFNFSDIKDEEGEKIGVRLYFLGILPDSPDNTLVYMDYVEDESRACELYEGTSGVSKTTVENEDTMNVDDDNTQTIVKTAKSKKYLWKPLLNLTEDKHEDDKTNKQELSLQEKLQLERKRIMATGITNYEYHATKKRFMFTLSGNLYYVDDDGEPPYEPIQIKTESKEAKINPTFCPTNADLIAYVKSNNLYVANIKTGQEAALTNLKRQFPIRQMTAGLPSYVVQEEFSRYTGFWWRDNGISDHQAGAKVEHQVVYELVDETEVEELRISTWDGSVEDYRFPKPGKKNAYSNIAFGSFIYETETGSITEGQSHQLPMIDDLKTLYPSFEYFVRAKFVTTNDIALQLLDREQKLLLVYLVSLTGRYKPQVICYEHITPHWVHVTDVLEFINLNPYGSLQPNDMVDFLWASQQTGFRHLYKHRVKIIPNAPLGKENIRFEGDLADLNQVCHTEAINCVQLTSGNWEVSDKECWLDSKSQLLYFMARKESPLETHLYAINYNSNPCSMVKLTTSGYSHGGVAFNSDFSAFTTLQSSISVPPFGHLYKIQKAPMNMPTVETVAKIIDNNECHLELLNPNFADEHLPTFAKPELFTYQLKDSGEVVYGLIFKPDFMEADVKYPVLLEVYGGPGVQLINNSYRSVRLLRRHLLASQGYVVCAFDCRGSYNRGVKFEDHLRNRLGQVEVADQVEVLQYLASTLNYIDLSRVAVHGWSYGGYLSLLCLAQRPDIFKLCVAGAPVTNWELYDSGYTERYLGLPQKQSQQYQAGSVISHVPKLPSENNRLLIMHGMMDENVHFQHTVELIQELIKAGKPYQLQIFPYERHSLRNQSVREYYFTYLLWHFNNYL